LSSKKLLWSFLDTYKVSPKLSNEYHLSQWWKRREEMFPRTFIIWVTHNLEQYHRFYSCVSREGELEKPELTNGIFQALNLDSTKFNDLISWHLFRSCEVLALGKWYLTRISKMKTVQLID